MHAGRETIADQRPTQQRLQAVPRHEVAERHLQRALPAVELAAKLAQSPATQQVREMDRLLVLAQNDRLRTNAAQKHRHVASRHEVPALRVHPEKGGRRMRLLPVLRSLAKPAERVLSIAVEMLPLYSRRLRNRRRPLPFVAEGRLIEDDGHSR